VDKNNNQKVAAVFMNPAENYHAPLKAFLELKGYRVILVDPGVSEKHTEAENLGKEKSDRTQKPLSMMGWLITETFNTSVCIHGSLQQSYHNIVLLPQG